MPLRYVVALGCVGAACLLQHLILPYPSKAPFIFFFVAVTAASWAGGRGAGLVATALSLLLGNVLFTEPILELTLSGQAGRATAFFGVAGALIALLGGSLREAMQDARDALQAQQKAVHESQTAKERLQLAKSAARLGVYDHDLKTGVIEWDDRLREIWGIGSTAPVDWGHLVTSIHPDDRDRLVAAIEQSHANGTGYVVEYRFTNARDGLERCVRATGQVLFEGGGPSRHVGTVEDITERQRAEAALRAADALHAANAQLRKEDQRRTQFLAVLSHELRNPLMPIRNSLYILERAVPEGEQARRARAVIGRQVDHLCHLVDDLLDVTRISRGKIRLRRTRIDLADLVRRTVDDHRASLEVDHVFLEDLPPEPMWIDGDPTRLTQVVGNLLTNAAKFTPGGGTITLSLRRAGRSAVLEVADTGIGIDQDTLRRLFQPFAQADRSLDRSSGGLGLGLALVRGIVDLHGGEVTAHSDGPGLGARLVIELPLEERAVVAPGSPRATESAPTGRTVLIIEDNRDAADTLYEILCHLGHHVTVAYDGAAGVARAIAERPEIVLCDIGLPAGMDGYAVARALRREPRTRPAYLVAVTGYAQAEDRQRALDAGFDAHVAKPPSLDALERLVAQARVPDRAAGDDAHAP